MSSERLSSFPPQQALSPTPLATGGEPKANLETLPHPAGRRNQCGNWRFRRIWGWGQPGEGMLHSGAGHTLPGWGRGKRETKASLQLEPKRKDAAQETPLDLRTQRGSPPVLEDRQKSHWSSPEQRAELCGAGVCPGAVRQLTSFTPIPNVTGQALASHCTGRESGHEAFESDGVGTPAGSATHCSVPLARPLSCPAPLPRL